MVVRIGPLVRRTRLSAWHRAFRDLGWHVAHRSAILSDTSHQKTNSIESSFFRNSLASNGVRMRPRKSVSCRGRMVGNTYRPTREQRHTLAEPDFASRRAVAVPEEHRPSMSNSPKSSSKLALLVTKSSSTLNCFSCEARPDCSIPSPRADHIAYAGHRKQTPPAGPLLRHTLRMARMLLENSPATFS